MNDEQALDSWFPHFDLSYNLYLSPVLERNIMKLRPFKIDWLNFNLRPELWNDNNHGPIINSHVVENLNIVIILGT